MEDGLMRRSVWDAELRTDMSDRCAVYELVDPPESLQGYHQQPLENTWKEDR